MDCVGFYVYVYRFSGGWVDADGSMGPESDGRKLESGETEKLEELGRGSYVSYIIMVSGSRARGPNLREERVKKNKRLLNE